MLKAIRNFLNKRRTAQCRVSSSEQGVTFLKGNVESGGFTWLKVKRIVTYKDDLMTVDLICLEFETQDGLIYLAHDEAPGFDQLCANMGKKFAGIDSDWLLNVMHPAFAKNYTVLYDSAA